MYGGYYWYYDSTYILVIIGGLLCLTASGYLNSTFSKYSKIRNRRGMTGAEVAERILKSEGINDVQVIQTRGSLTDHYHPGKKAVALSESVYDSHSLAAIGVAAHECGHAIQHHKGYVPLSLRSAIAPVMNIASKVGLPLVIAGILLGLYDSLVLVGIVIFGVAVVFQLITLPVEFNASTRATQKLSDMGILYEEEKEACKKVLFAAALTYVAAAASSLLQLLRLLMLSGSRRRRDHF